MDVDGKKEKVQRSERVRNEVMRRKTRKGMLTFRLVGGRRGGVFGANSCSWGLDFSSFGAWMVQYLGWWWELRGFGMEGTY